MEFKFCQHSNQMCCYRQFPCPAHQTTGLEISTMTLVFKLVFKWILIPDSAGKKNLNKNFAFSRKGNRDLQVRKGSWAAGKADRALTECFNASRRDYFQEMAEAYVRTEHPRISK